MDLYFRGHDYRYAVEQTMLTLFPGQLPRYPQGEPEGASPSALVTLEEEQDGAFAARAVLWWEGRRYEAGAAARVEPGSDALSARRARQRTVRLAFYDAAVQALGHQPPWRTSSWWTAEGGWPPGPPGSRCWTSSPACTG